MQKTLVSLFFIMKTLRFLLPLLLLIPACAEKANPDETPFRYDVTFQVDESNFCNPERGMYVPTIKYLRDNFTSPASAVDIMRNWRNNGRTFTYSEFYITGYVYKDLSEDALEMIRTHLERHREAGMKTIVRFAYSEGMEERHHPWDATLEQTLRHVAQLKPIFQEFEDIIYVVQYGFVGSWGEGYYTDNYGMNPKTDEDYWARRELMNALLDAVPESRQIAVRYPAYKRGILGLAVGDTITAKTAFGNSGIARVAAFNDCFVSAYDDVGTYKSNYDREMWATETNYVSMGGETCRAPKTYCNCDKTYENLEKYHWTYLNEAFNKETHKVWMSESCYDDIIKRLGYRLVLNGAAFSGRLTAGGNFTVKLHLKNVGFASLINYRPMQWVLVNAAKPSEKYVIPSPKDPREWKGGHEYVYEETLKLPDGLTPGTKYKLALELPDAAETLAGNPDFSVRFANLNVFDEETGWNVLTTLTAE